MNIGYKYYAWGILCSIYMKFVTCIILNFAEIVRIKFLIQMIVVYNMFMFEKKKHNNMLLLLINVCERIQVKKKKNCCWNLI